MYFTIEEYTDMHLVYGEMNCNGRAAARRYGEKFPDRRQPHHSSFAKLHQRLRETGSLIPKPHSGRHANVRDQHEDIIIRNIEENPEISTRRLSARYQGISKSLVSNIIRRYNMHPYHFTKVQAMGPNDFHARLVFCNWVRNKILQNAEFLSFILFSDEATFTKEGIFNSHNAHFYAYKGDNPHVTRIRGFQERFSINTWIGVVGDNLIGPVELPNRLNAETYLHFLENTLPNLLDNVNLNIRGNLWFQQDGCPAHYQRDVRNFLNATYGQHWIGRGGPVNWPPRSPDLNPCDFCIWGYLKSLVYSRPIETRLQLWESIQEACTELRNNVGIFARIRRSMRNRINLCIENNGSHVEHNL